MKKLKKITFRILLVFVILIPVAAFAHFIIFPQESRCILIAYSSFKKDGRLYFNANTSPAKLDTLKMLIEQASLRVANRRAAVSSAVKPLKCQACTPLASTI